MCLCDSHLQKTLQRWHRILIALAIAIAISLAITISLAVTISAREIVRFVQGRRIHDASVGARNELVREMRPVVERQSGPTIGTAGESSSVQHVQPNRRSKETIMSHSMLHEVTYKRRGKEQLTRPKL